MTWLATILMSVTVLLAGPAKDDRMVAAGTPVGSGPPVVEARLEARANRFGCFTAPMDIDGAVE